MHASKKILSFLAPALAMVLLATAGPDLALAAKSGPGREYGRCIFGCNAARRDCRKQCRSTCRELFPGRDQRAERRECRIECFQACGEQHQACRADCDSIKPPISPGNP